MMLSTVLGNAKVQKFHAAITFDISEFE